MHTRGQTKSSSTTAHRLGYGFEQTNPNPKYETLANNIFFHTSNMNDI